MKIQNFCNTTGTKGHFIRQQENIEKGSDFFVQHIIKL